MKKILIIMVVMFCFLMTACSDDENTYELTEADLEKVYTWGYQHGYSDCSYYEAEKCKPLSEKYFQDFVDYMNAEYGKVTGADIYTELYENQYIPKSIEADEVEEPKEKYIEYEDLKSTEYVDE